MANVFSYRLRSFTRASLRFLVRATHHSTIGMLRFAMPSCWAAKSSRSEGSRRTFAVLLSLGIAICISAQPRSSPRPPAGKPYLQEVRMDKLSAFILAFDIANGSDLTATALADRRIRVWRLGSGEIVHEFSFPSPETDEHLKVAGEVEPISVRFSPDGKRLAISFLSRIYFYDVDTWTEKMSLGVPGEDQHRADLKITPETPQLERRSTEQAQADKNKPVLSLNETLRAWALAAEKGDGRTRITDFTFTIDGSSVIVAYCRGKCYATTWLRWEAFPTGNDPVRLWDIASGRLVWEHVYDEGSLVDRIVPSPDGTRFAVVQSHPGHCAVGMHNFSDGQTLWLHSVGSCGDPPSIRFSEDSQSFIANRVEEGNRENKLWRDIATYETSSGKMIGDFSKRDTVRNFDISVDGRWLASTTWSGLRFQIWDLSSRKAIMMETPQEWGRRGPLMNRIRFSPDGRWLVVGNNQVGAWVIYRFGPSWHN
jgi:WD40 repeat protein